MILLRWHLIGKLQKRKKGGKRKREEQRQIQEKIGMVKDSDKWKDAMKERGGNIDIRMRRTINRKNRKLESDKCKKNDRHSLPFFGRVTRSRTGGKKEREK